MVKLAVSAVRVIVLAVLAVSIGLSMIWQFQLPAKVQSLLLGGGAIIFAISDGYFSRLLSGINEVFRRSGYSVWQIEQLSQIIPPLRSRVWRLWIFSLALKAIVIAMAAVLFLDNLAPLYYNLAIYFGYCFLCVAIVVSYWTWRTFWKIEGVCDELTAKEAEKRESRRLKAEMTAGSTQDFKADGIIKSYENPPQTV